MKFVNEDFESYIPFGALKKGDTFIKSNDFQQEVFMKLVPDVGEFNCISLNTAELHFCMDNAGVDQVDATLSFRLHKE